MLDPILGIEMEEWIPIPGYPGFEVSDWGRVKRLYRELVVKANRFAPEGTVRHRKEWITQGNLNNHGYYRVDLYDETGAKVQKEVQTLVLRAFVGPPPEGQEARHADRDPKNNRLSNLSWGTRLDQCNDKRRHGTTPKGDHNGHAVLNEQDVRFIRWLNKCLGMGSNRIAPYFGVSGGNVRMLCSGKSWGHIPMEDFSR